jgi:hypothetical protein
MPQYILREDKKRRKRMRSDRYKGERRENKEESKKEKKEDKNEEKKQKEKIGGERDEYIGKQEECENGRNRWMSIMRKKRQQDRKNIENRKEQTRMKENNRENKHKEEIIKEDKQG